MEAFVRENLMNHMIQNKLISDCQHGFQPKRSCVTQLLIVLEDWSKLIANGDNIDVIYCDFKSAFDSVPHQRLLSKLHAYGIRGNLFNWIKAFLTDRRQRVQLEGQSSDWTEVTSGIPQGTLCGPILFLLFINDLPDKILNTIQIFADDTKVYNAIKNLDCRNKLQNDIDALLEWTKLWQLGFNTSKCKILHIGNSNPEYDYLMDNKNLEITKIEKDLGVHIDTNLKFHHHVKEVTKKANQRLGMIKRTFKYLDTTAFTYLYIAIIRPILEYANVIWNPRFICDEEKVERVQRRATKFIPELRDLEYEERLIKLNLYSLIYRRRRYDIIQVYRIMNKIDNLDKDKFFIMSRDTNPYNTKGNSLKNDTRKFSFSQRIIDDWNSLPDDIVCSESLNVLKCKLDKFWSGERFKNVSLVRERKTLTQPKTENDHRNTS